MYSFSGCESYHSDAGAARADVKVVLEGALPDMTYIPKGGQAATATYKAPLCTERLDGVGWVHTLRAAATRSRGRTASTPSGSA